MLCALPHLSVTVAGPRLKGQGRNSRARRSVAPDYGGATVRVMVALAASRWRDKVLRVQSRGAGNRAAAAVPLFVRHLCAAAENSGPKSRRRQSSYPQCFVLAPGCLLCTPCSRGLPPLLFRIIWTKYVEMFPQYLYSFVRSFLINTHPKLGYFVVKDSQLNRKSRRNLSYGEALDAARDGR